MDRSSTESVRVGVKNLNNHFEGIEKTQEIDKGKESPLLIIDSAHRRKESHSIISDISYTPKKTIPASEVKPSRYTTSNGNKQTTESLFSPKGIYLPSIKEQS